MSLYEMRALMDYNVLNKKLGMNEMGHLNYDLLSKRPLAWTGKTIVELSFVTYDEVKTHCNP